MLTSQTWIKLIPHELLKLWAIKRKLKQQF